MTEILGTPTSLSMRVSRKLGDKFFGSGEVSAELTINLAEADNLQDAWDTLDAWLTAQVADSINEKRKEWEKWFALQPADFWESGPPEQYGIGDERAVPPPRNEANVPVTPQNQPVAQSSGQMVTEMWQNPVMTIEFTKAGDKYLRVKGGKWLKFGCPAWAETIPFTYFTDWEPGNEYRLPDGLTEAVVQMNEKGQPKKVIEFR